jgi:hypothetical protein
MPNPKKPQLERFIETARQLACDDDKERFEEKLGRIAKAKPKPSQPETGAITPRRDSDK